MKKIILYLICLLSISLGFAQTRIGATSGIGGSGTIGKVPVFTASKTVGNSALSSTLTSVGINTLSTAANFHVVSTGSTVSTFNSKFFNSINRNLLSIYDSGVLLGAGNSLENEFVFGVSSGYIGSGGDFTCGSLNFNSNFRFKIKGNSEIYYESIHNSGQTNRIGYFGGSIYKISSSTVSDISYLSPNVLRLGINSSETNIENSSVLQINSTTQGFLPPRMTTAERNAISSPAVGLVVYDTTLNKLCVYTGSWEVVTSS